MHIKSTAVGILTIVTLLGAGCNMPSSVSSNDISSILDSGTPKYTGDTQTYTDPQFKFSFNYPKGGKETELDDHSSDDTLPYTSARKIEFYKDQTTDTMDAGDYFVELYVYSHKDKSKLEGGCGDKFKTPDIKTINGIKIYRGTEKKAEYGYSDALDNTLCVEAPDYDLYMHGNEEIDTVANLPVIFDSFQVTK